MWDLIVSVPDHCLSFYFPLCSCLNLLSDKFKPTYISCLLLKFCVICFCFQKNVVYIFPALSGWGNQIVWSTRPNLVA